MRFVRATIFALAALTSAAHAETTAPAKHDHDQMERNVTMSPTALSPETSDVTRSLQSELKRVGCFGGTVDGVWDVRTKTALAEFARRAKVDVDTDAATPVAVGILQARRDRVCPLECGAGLIERNGQCVAKAAPPAPPPPAAAKPPARPQNVEARRPARERSQDERPGSGMCWRNDGRGTSLVPCHEAPTGRRAY